MARIRSVHPGLFTDEAFALLTIEKPLAVAFLIGLWCEADDAGVFEWKPLGLKMKVLPGTTADAAELLAILERLNFIRRFEVAPRAFGVVRNFVKFQRPKKPNDIHPATAEMRGYAGFLPDGRRPHSGTGRPSGGESSEPDPIDGETNPEPAVFLRGASSEPPAPIAPHSSEPVPNHAETPPETPRQMEEGGGRRKGERGKKSSSSSSACAVRQIDDDELRAKLRTAAKGRIRKTCVNVKPVREWMAKGCDLERDILPFIAEAFPRLSKPLATWGGPNWPGPDILAFSQERRDAEARGESPGQAAFSAQIFVNVNSAHWARVAEIYRRKTGRQNGPPAYAHGPDGKGHGWYFSVAMLASDKALATEMGLNEAAE